MKPYLRNVDRSTPLGDLICDYGQYQWTIGFTVGFLTGTLLMSTVVLFRTKHN